MAKILFAGESWSVTSVHAKGFDTFTTTEYAEGGVSHQAATSSVASARTCPVESSSASARDRTRAVVLPPVEEGTVMTSPLLKSRNGRVSPLITHAT